MKETRKRHPAYGVAGFSRVGGRFKRLFGSHLPNHESVIALRIGRAEEITSDGSTHVWSSAKDAIVEVYFSAAQFAELLTTMNIGNGVPCTIRHVMREAAGPIPESDSTEIQRVRDAFQARADQLSADVSTLEEQVAELLEKKGALTKAEKDQIRHNLSTLKGSIRSGLPYVIEQFEEATEKVVQHAKAELDAATTRALELQAWVPRLRAEPLAELAEAVRDDEAEATS